MNLNRRFLIIENRGKLADFLEFELKNHGEVSRITLNPKESPDIGALSAAVTAFRPDALFNLCVLHDEPKSEENKKSVRTMNLDLPVALAHGLIGTEGLFVHLSDASVYDGSSSAAFFDENNIVNPVTYVGKTRAIAEQKLLTSLTHILILRCDDALICNEENFAERILNAAGKRKGLKLRDDLLVSPISPRMCAKMIALSAIKTLAEPDLEGLYHLGGAKSDEYRCAEAVVETARRFSPEKKWAQVTLATASKTTHLNYPALDCTAFQEAFAVILPDWKDSVAEVAVTALMHRS